MSRTQWPVLVGDDIATTRDAVHAYSQVVGAWLEACRPRRKHWWHISLRPTVRGLTTGPVHAEIDFEFELDLQASRLLGRVAGGNDLEVQLIGQAPASLAAAMQQYLRDAGLPPERTPAGDANEMPPTDGYTPAAAQQIALTWAAVSGALATLRAGIPEETSPIQLWPHHFDLSMVWLPGEKIRGQDPADEEHSDKQMNFGFALGDGSIPEPYFYITAYPEPEAFASLSLPTGARWMNEGFSGAVLLYRDLLAHDGPESALLNLWRELIAAGHKHLLKMRG